MVFILLKTWGCKSYFIYLSIFIYFYISAKKQARKDDQERKKQEALLKKKERDELARLEEKEVTSKLAKVNPVKVTQAKIREENEKRALAAKKSSTKKPEPETHLTKPIAENINR